RLLETDARNLRRRATNRQRLTRRRWSRDQRRVIVGERRAEQRKLTRWRNARQTRRSRQHAVAIRGGVAHHGGLRRQPRVARREISERIRRARIGANRQFGSGLRRAQREFISAVAAAVDLLEPQVAALRTLHGSFVTASN